MVSSAKIGLVTSLFWLLRRNKYRWFSGSNSNGAAKTTWSWTSRAPRCVPANTQSGQYISTTENSHTLWQRALVSNCYKFRRRLPNARYRHKMQRLILTAWFLPTWTTRIYHLHITTGPLLRHQCLTLPLLIRPHLRTLLLLLARRPPNHKGMSLRLKFQATLCRVRLETWDITFQPHRICRTFPICPSLRNKWSMQFACSW